MRVLALASLSAAVYGQEVVQIARRLGLADDTDHAKWWHEDADAIQSIKGCFTSFKMRSDMAGNAVSRNEARDWAYCLAKKHGQDLHKVLADPHASDCYGREVDNFGAKYATHYDPEFNNCIARAARYQKMCESELEAVPVIRDFMNKIDEYEDFFWCYYSASQSIWNSDPDMWEWNDSAYGLAREAIGTCLKEVGRRDNLGDLTARDLKGLYMFWKRNCRLSIHSEDNSPCENHQDWTDDGECVLYQCVCSGNGSPPTSEDPLAIQELCWGHGEEACGTCDEGWTGEDCLTEV